MGEHDALGEPGGAGSVLHHDAVVVVEAPLDRTKVVLVDMLTEQEKDTLVNWILKLDEVASL
jgi:hypothetical protein